MKKYTLALIAASTAAVFLALTALPLLVEESMAEESRFRKEFIENYRGNHFKKQVVLVKRNKAVIPSEIESFIQDAEAEASFAGKMFYLDMANTLATMHIHWNKGDERLLEKVAALQKAELDKQKKLDEARKRIEEAEAPPGNFVLNTRKDAMERAGVAPVLYPHWVHRSFYRCKVCHESIFKMKRGQNALSQRAIEKGRQCGECHNGKYSFDAASEDNCIRCHSFGKEESRPLIDLSYYDEDKFEKIAKRIGSKWYADKLVDGKLPLDKMGFINWVELDRLRAFWPLTRINGEQADEGIRDTLIHFEMPDSVSSFMKDVVFSHKIHTTWIRCSICHPRIFEKRLGANKVSMMAIKDGESCGTCHGRVSFTYKDCLRCHATNRDEVPSEALKRP